MSSPAQKRPLRQAVVHDSVPERILTYGLPATGFGSGAFVSLSPSLIAQISDVRQIGVRTGSLFAVISIAALISQPIGGAIIQRWHGSYTGLQIYVSRHSESEEGDGFGLTTSFVVGRCIDNFRVCLTSHTASQTMLTLLRAFIILIARWRLAGFGLAVKV